MTDTQIAMALVGYAPDLIFEEVLAAIANLSAETRTAIEAKLQELEQKWQDFRDNAEEKTLVKAETVAWNPGERQQLILDFQEEVVRMARSVLGFPEPVAVPLSLPVRVGVKRRA